MKGWALYGVIMTVVAVAAVGVASWFAISQATDEDSTAAEPSATDYAPTLTGAEAAALAKQFVRDGIRDQGGSDQALARIEKLACSPEDFNDSRRVWIVKCEIGGYQYRYAVDDQTGQVGVIG